MYSLIYVVGFVEWCTPLQTAMQLIMGDQIFGYEAMNKIRTATQLFGEHVAEKNGIGCSVRSYANSQNVANYGKPFDTRCT